jgi:thiol-disulfide isomerase/thioredoxin
MPKILELTVGHFIKRGNEYICIPFISRPGFILVYADWCGYCTTFKPTYKSAALQNKMLFAQVNHDQTDVINELKITSYPTILYINNDGIVSNISTNQVERSYFEAGTRTHP